MKYLPESRDKRSVLKKEVHCTKVGVFVIVKLAGWKAG